MEAVEIGRAVDHTYGTLIAMVWHAGVQIERGRLREADDALRRAARFVAEEGVELLPAAGVVHIGMGALLYERNDLEEAERELKRGIKLAERTREVSSLVWGYVTLSQTKRARGDVEGALEMAREAERVAGGPGAGPEVAIAGAWITQLLLARGELAAAGAFQRERAANADAAGDASRVVDRVTSARVLHAQGRYADALGLLEEPREATEAAGRTSELIGILALTALVLWSRNEKEQAVNTLTRALALAEPEGYVRTFVDEGPAMGDLLSEVLHAQRRGRPDTGTPSVPAQYLAKLLAALAREDVVPAADERLSEPVSERELEVLALIAAGRSNQEIAAKLFVSTSTVKTHVNNLYRKLDARSRTQAVARAREMGVL